MPIENPVAYLAGIWNWEPLRQCFPRGVMPTDIDGMVELGGRFLVLEAKAEGVPIKHGQVKMFQAMASWNRRLEGLFTIIVFWGDAEASHVSHIQFWPNEIRAGTWADLQEYIRAWAEWAEERAAIENQ